MGWVRGGGAISGQPQNSIVALGSIRTRPGTAASGACASQPAQHHPQHHPRPSSIAGARLQPWMDRPIDSTDSPLARDVKVDVLPGLVLHGCDGGWSACTELKGVGLWGKKIKGVTTTKNARTASGGLGGSGRAGASGPKQAPESNPSLASPIHPAPICHSIDGPRRAGSMGNKERKATRSGAHTHERGPWPSIRSPMIRAARPPPLLVEL